MVAKTHRFLLVLAVLGVSGTAATVARAGDADADGSAPPRISWWVEGRPWTCSDPVGAVARQAALACDASGGRCRIASSRDEADRVAAITCATRDGSWKLEAEDASGQPLWSVSLGGDAEARARKAGLWIARAESDGPQADDAMNASAPLSPPASPPPPSPPTAPAPSSGPAPAAVPTVTVVAPSLGGSGEKPAPRAKSSEEPRIVMTASVLSAAPIADVTSNAGAPPMTGGRFAAAFRALDGGFVGAAVDGMTVPGQQSTTYSHIGALVAVGAPFTHDWIGASVEGGVALAIQPDVTSPAYDPAYSPLTAHAYGKGTLAVQWPRQDGIRPYLAVSYLASTDAMNRTVLADIGLAWGAW